MSRARGITAMLAAGGPPRCPQCGSRLGFSTDRLGRTTEACGCGYGAYVALRATEPIAHPTKGPTGAAAAS